MNKKNKLILGVLFLVGILLNSTFAISFENNNEKIKDNLKMTHDAKMNSVRNIKAIKNNENDLDNEKNNEKFGGLKEEKKKK